MYQQIWVNLPKILPNIIHACVQQVIYICNLTVNGLGRVRTLDKIFSLQYL